jgi:hypothetical protein
VTVAFAQRTAEALLLQLSIAAVHRDAARLTAPWALFCRAVAMGLRPSGAGGAPPPAGRDGGDDDNGRDEADTEGLGGGAAPAAGASGAAAASVTSPQQYVVWCRERAARRAQRLPGGGTARLRVKVVAVRCAAAALAALAARAATTAATAAASPGAPIDPPPDLAQARAASERALTSPPPPTTDAALAALPCYMALFVYDWVTTACACATFTTDDHLVPGLQEAALALLKEVPPSLPLPLFLPPRSLSQRTLPLPHRDGGTSLPLIASLSPPPRSLSQHTLPLPRYLPPFPSPLTRDNSSCPPL